MVGRFKLLGVLKTEEKRLWSGGAKKAEIEYDKDWWGTEISSGVVKWDSGINKEIDIAYTFKINYSASSY